VPHSQRQGARLCLIILLLLPLQMAEAEILTIDAATVDGIVPAIHGVTNGPIISSHPSREPPCQNFHPADHSATFQEWAIPQVRTHGGAETDLNLIWEHYPNYAGHDPSNENNYHWERADEAVAQIVAVGAQPFIRIGQSKNGTPNAPCDPNLNTTMVPDDFQVFGEVAKRILMHFTQGWDNGFFYDIEYVEVWNEFYEPDFWSGTGTEAAELYEATYIAVKAALPDIKLGPSINRPLTLNPLPHDFWNYIETHAVPVDFVSVHLYADQPRDMEISIHQHQDDRSWEDFFALVDHLPVDTPIVNSEWNRRISCSLIGGNGNTVPGGAFVAGALIAMAGMHPANSDHNLVMSHLFSARSQIWNAALQPKAPGVGLEAYAKLVTETPERLVVSDDHVVTADVDFRIMAGRSGDARRVNLLVSYYDTSQTTCPNNSHTSAMIPLTVNVMNLPWGDAPFLWKRWVHTANTALTLEASGSGIGGTFSTTQTMHANVLELYEFERIHSVPAGDPGPVFIALLSIGLFMIKSKSKSRTAGSLNIRTPA
jgi:hypothetical protein